jgi:hypothetical protein
VSVNHSALRQLGGNNHLAVYLSIPGFKPSDDEKLWLAKFTLGMALRDGRGGRSRGILVPARQFDMMGLDPRDLSSYGGSRMFEDSLFAQGDPTQWVALFPVSPQAEGFTLLLTNPNPRAGQPGSAVVDLGR